jgi:hypothetical protein
MPEGFYCNTRPARVIAAPDAEATPKCFSAVTDGPFELVVGGKTFCIAMHFRRHGYHLGHKSALGACPPSMGVWFSGIIPL